MVDKGIVETQWGKKPKVQLRWQLGVQAGVRDDGKPWLVVRTFTASLHEKAELTKCLVRWRKKPFTPEELARFDLETVIGAVGLGNIVHVTLDDGRVFANVDTIVPLPKEMPRPSIRDYIREINREPLELEVDPIPTKPVAPKPQPKPQTFEPRLEELIEVVAGLGYPEREAAIGAINRIAVKNYKGEWAMLSPRQKDAMVATARKTLSERLDAEAAVDDTEAEETS